MDASPYSEHAAVVPPRSAALRLADHLAERHHAAVMQCREVDSWEPLIWREALMWLLAPPRSPELHRAEQQIDHPAHTEAVALRHGLTTVETRRGRALDQPGDR